MDPNLFHLDWERTFEAVTTIVVLSFFVERALALIFENRRLMRVFDNSGMKEPIAFVVSTWLCWQLKFDALSIIILTDSMSAVGYAITGAVVAGGTKASIKFFHGMLGVYSNAMGAKIERKKKEQELQQVSEPNVGGVSPAAAGGSR